MSAFPTNGPYARLAIELPGVRGWEERTMSVGMAVDAVAKKKSRAAKAGPTERKPMVVQIRGSEAWKAWVESLAERERDTVAKLVERVLTKHAREIKFTDPPKR
jgi:hypothetical protein